MVELKVVQEHPKVRPQLAELKVLREHLTLVEPKNELHLTFLLLMLLQALELLLPAVQQKLPLLYLLVSLVELPSSVQYY